MGQGGWGEMGQGGWGRVGGVGEKCAVKSATECIHRVEIGCGTVPET